MFLIAALLVLYVISFQYLVIDFFGDHSFQRPLDGKRKIQLHDGVPSIFTIVADSFGFTVECSAFFSKLLFDTTAYQMTTAFFASLILFPFILVTYFPLLLSTFFRIVALLTIYYTHDGDEKPAVYTSEPTFAPFTSRIMEYPNNRIYRGPAIRAQPQGRYEIPQWEQRPTQQARDANRHIEFIFKNLPTPRIAPYSLIPSTTIAQKTTKPDRPQRPLSLESPPSLTQTIPSQVHTTSTSPPAHIAPTQVMQEPLSYHETDAPQATDPKVDIQSPISLQPRVLPILPRTVLSQPTPAATQLHAPILSHIAEPTKERPPVASIPCFNPPSPLPSSPSPVLSHSSLENSGPSYSSSSTSLSSWQLQPPPILAPILSNTTVAQETQFCTPTSEATSAVEVVIDEDMKEPSLHVIPSQVFGPFDVEYVLPGDDVSYDISVDSAMSEANEEAQPTQPMVDDKSRDSAMDASNDEVFLTNNVGCDGPTDYPMSPTANEVSECSRSEPTGFIHDSLSAPNSSNDLKPESMDTSPILAPPNALNSWFNNGVGTLTISATPLPPNDSMDINPEHLGASLNESSASSSLSAPTSWNFGSMVPTAPSNPGVFAVSGSPVSHGHQHQNLATTSTQLAPRLGTSTGVFNFGRINLGNVAGQQLTQQLTFGPSTTSPAPPNCFKLSQAAPPFIPGTGPTISSVPQTIPSVQAQNQATSDAFAPSAEPGSWSRESIVKSQFAAFPPSTSSDLMCEDVEENKEIKASQEGIESDDDGDGEENDDVPTAEPTSWFSQYLERAKAQEASSSSPNSMDEEDFEAHLGSASKSTTPSLTNSVTSFSASSASSSLNASLSTSTPVTVTNFLVGELTGVLPPPLGSNWLSQVEPQKPEPMVTIYNKPIQSGGLFQSGPLTATNSKQASNSGGAFDFTSVTTKWKPTGVSPFASINSVGPSQEQVTRPSQPSTPAPASAAPVLLLPSSPSNSSAPHVPSPTIAPNPITNSATATAPRQRNPTPAPKAPNSLFRPKPALALNMSNKAMASGSRLAKLASARTAGSITGGRP